LVAAEQQSGTQSTQSNNTAVLTGAAKHPYCTCAKKMPENKRADTALLVGLNAKILWNI
jgi:hypothetical protein